jgi:hypothetical protein
MAGGTKWLLLGAVFAAAISGVVSFSAFSSTSAPEASLAESTTTTHVDVQARAFYVSPAEVAVGPAVLVASELTVDSGSASVKFDLHHLTPIVGLPPGGVIVPFQGWQVLEPGDIPTVFPDSWTMIIDGDEVTGTVSNPKARAARFDVPIDATVEDVQAIRLDGYRISVPIDQPFAFDSSVSIVSAGPGVTATLVQVAEQSDTTIVRVELRLDNPEDAGGIDIEGSGPGWLGAFREAEGGLRWNLTYSGAAPERIELRLRGSLWLRVHEEIEIHLGAPNG